MAGVFESQVLACATKRGSLFQDGCQRCARGAELEDRYESLSLMSDQRSLMRPNQMRQASRLKASVGFCEAHHSSAGAASAGAAWNRSYRRTEGKLVSLRPGASPRAEHRQMLRANARALVPCPMCVCVCVLVSNAVLPKLGQSLCADEPKRLTRPRAQHHSEQAGPPEHFCRARSACRA